MFRYEWGMTDPSVELSASLSSVESLKIYLAGLVGAASDNRNGDPVRLTYVGGEFAKNVGVPFEKHVTALADGGRIAIPKARRKLAPFVQAYCDDIFTIIEDLPGVFFIARAGTGEVGAHRASGSHTQATLRFHRAAWTAFIRPLEGKRRFLNLDRIGFTDSTEAPSDGNWREINQRFILGLAPGAPVDGLKLQKLIEEWAQETQVPISRLVIGAKPPRGPSRHLELLFEIIDALPAPLAASWAIPAAVLKHLRDER